MRMSERGQERAISHGILSNPIFKDLFGGVPREPSSEENRVRT
jgi:hypothetical protein